MKWYTNFQFYYSIFVPKKQKMNITKYPLSNWNETALKIPSFQRLPFLVSIHPLAELFRWLATKFVVALSWCMDRLKYFCTKLDNFFFLKWEMTFVTCERYALNWEREKKVTNSLKMQFYVTMYDCMCMQSIYTVTDRDTLASEL